MANKLNLVFDFNNMAMRALFTCAYAGDIAVSTYDTDEECGVLIRKIAIDMSYLIRAFSPNRVIIACDAKHPWRNELYDPSGDESYKGTRVKDTTKNWDKIWEALNEYKEILKERGFIVTEIAHAEADDLAALWKMNSFDNDNNIVLISSDKDWVQLVEYNNKNYCVCLNPIANNKQQKKLYLTQKCSDWLNSPSTTKTDIFFTNYNTSKDTLKNIKTKDPKISFEIVDPNKVVLTKIMCGDDGDNAPAFYHYYSPKTGKKVRITETKAKKIFENLNINNVKDLSEAAEAGALKTEIEAVLKKELDDIDVNERLMRQRKLVQLTPVLFPFEIQDAFTYHALDNEENGFVPAESVKMDVILAKTKFLKEGYNRPRESKIFDNLKDLEKYIKPLPTASKSLF